jgi:amino acid adenylation domain-containing protein
MTTAAEGAVLALLADLAAAGVKLRIAGDGQLEVTARNGGLPAGLRSRISERKPEILDWLARSQPGPAPHGGLPVVVPEPERNLAPFPPSDLQTSFLIGSQAGFEHPVRPHQYMEFDFAELDPDRYEAALNAALRRQRANLVVVRDGTQLAAVADPEPVRVRVTDLRGQTAQQAGQSLARVRERMQRRELPQDRWPWLDVEISLSDGGRGRLHYNNNNFFSDAPGTFRFLESVMRLYREPALVLPELPASTRDCVLALAALEESPSGQAARSYWYDRMAGWPGPPDLPLAAGADTRRRSRLERREMTLQAEVWAAVKDQAARRGLTPTSAACAAHVEVLAYWSGSRHFLLNNMISHRMSLQPQLAEVIGNFAALYPLEADWRHDEPFTARARRLQAQVIADLEHAQWSGTKVLQRLNQIRRTPGRAACPYAVGSALFVGPVDQPAHSLLETPQVVFDCEFWELKDGCLWVIWDVIEPMFPRGLIDAMQEGYLNLLTELAGGSAAWESAGPRLLPPAEVAGRRRLSRPEPAPQVPDGLLDDGLAAQAAASPEAPAVITSRVTLSYAGLRDRRARLAARLQDQGVQPGDLVAIALPKGWPQVVAVFAVLLAGAAYVPIDPRWPLDRIRYLLDDTSARAVLTTASLAGDLAGVTRAPVVTVTDTLCSEVTSAAAGTGTARPVARRADDLAYVIYTSGSTGQPKGAMLDHRGPLNTITDINRRYGISAGDVILGVSSLCFDLSVYDIFGSAAAGATVLIPDGDEADPAAWVDLARRHRVTTWNSVPALMQLFAAEAAAAGVQLPELRTVLLSGDWIPVGLPDQIRAVAPNARVISLGGATEASIWSICYPVDHRDPDWISIPYGRPLASQSWHVLDRIGRDAPVWTPGELYIGGVGLARGYLNDPERTAAAFVPHPRTGERLYRTGDLGRYLPSGDIEFLGRADFQVKIQGYRVEPGEIEHALLACPAVGQAAVVARESAGGKQLAAFVTQASRRPVDPDELVRFLAGRLPGHLVPATVTVLDELPLSANGKLDRRALLERTPSRPRDRRPGTAPRTPAEETIAQVWAAVLGSGPVGVHDDFFELGGQSFAALQVSSLLARRYGRRVPPGVLLERSTVAALADWLNSPDPGWSPRVWLHEGSGCPWYFVHPAGGGVVCYRRLAELLERPFCAFQAPGPAVGLPPLETVGELASTYRTVLRETQPHGPYQLGGWSSGAVIALELAHQLEREGEQVTRIVVIDSPAPATPRPVAESELMPWFLEDHGLDDDGPGASPADAGPFPGRADLATAFAVFRGVVRACHAYHAATVSAPISVLRAAQGTVSEFGGHPSATAPDWGWAARTTGPVTTVSIPGTHHTLLEDPQVIAVSQAIRALLGRG